MRGLGLNLMVTQYIQTRVVGGGKNAITDETFTFWGV